MVAKHKSSPAAELVDGQLWRIRGGFVRIGHVGKSLVHYKLMNSPEQRAVPARISSIHEVQSFLQRSHAQLMKNQKAKAPVKTKSRKPRR